MSTILKALKKVEAEKEISSSFEPALLAGFGSQETMHRAARFAWFKSRLVYSAGLVLVLFLVGIGIYTFSGSAQPQSVPPLHPVKTALPHQASESRKIVVPASTPRTIPTPLMTPVKRDVVKPSADLVTPPPPRTAIDRDEVLSIMARKPAASGMGQQLPSASKPVAEKPPKRERTLPGVDHRKVMESYLAKPMSSVPAQKEEPTPEPAVKQPAQTAVRSDTDTRFAGADKLTDGRLKVQAIVYADISEERMAVVNNRIVREGSTIDGFSVVGIGENALYVKEGLRTLMVPFGSP